MPATKQRPSATVATGAKGAKGAKPTKRARRLTLVSPAANAATAPAADEPTSQPPAQAQPAALDPHLVQADRLLQQLIALDAAPHPRMVNTEAAWWVLTQLVQRGTLTEAEGQALLYEGTAHVLADMLQFVEEQRATAKQSPAQSPRQQMQSALTRATAPSAPTMPGRPGERRTAGGLILP